MRGAVGGALAALGDPSRATIARILLAAPEGGVTVGRLAAELGLRQPTISHHLKVLLEAGLVVRTPHGREVWYSVAPDQLDRVADVVGVDAAPASRLGGPLLQRVVDDLATRFDGSLSRATIERFVIESHELLTERAGITRLLPSLTARFAADRLSALVAAGRASALPTVAGPQRPEVLFVCVQNAGRSQIAAAILRQLAGDRVVVRSAGSEPADGVRASIIATLDEIGVSIGGEYPKPLTDEVVRAADVVVTMGCGDACPVYPGRRYLDWAIDDPVGQPRERVRQIRDDIEARVRALLVSLDESAATATQP